MTDQTSGKSDRRKKMDAAFPFGGDKQSGWGRHMGYEAIIFTQKRKPSTLNPEDNPWSKSSPFLAAVAFFLHSLMESMQIMKGS